MIGYKTLFSTGTDEHGLKVQETAEKNKVSPQAWCDQISSKFKTLFDTTNISYDDYVRTTQGRHKLTVETMWNTLVDKGFIYLGRYEGWYCVSDETFLTSMQVVDGVDKDGKPIKISTESGNIVTWVTEENYKFKLSAFTEPLIKWIEETHPIIPRERENEVLNELRKGLQDLSVSRLREKISWGIPVPNDPKHVIYVWLDALTNYLTVTGFPNDPKWKSIWPADYHVIGKDILKFHCIYWPAFLMAANMPLPTKIVAHAHWTINREKMSKSKGNVIAPDTIIEKYGLETVRYFLLREGGLLNDGDFSDESITKRLTSELADTYGNLVSRSTAPALLSVQNTWPVEPADLRPEEIQLVQQLHELVGTVHGLYSNAAFGKGLEAILQVLYDVNKYFQDCAPWQLTPKKFATSDPEIIAMNKRRLQDILYITYEAIRVCSLLLQPIIPQKVAQVMDHFHIPKEHWNPLEHGYGYKYADMTKTAMLNNRPLILFAKNKVV
jgi:methionyl-tRNA synthetase